MKELRGIQASSGIVIGKVFLYSDEEPGIPNYSIEGTSVDSEWARFLLALDKAQAEVTLLRDRALSEMGKEQSAIFDSHLLMLSDPDLLDQLQDELRVSLRNIEWILFSYEQKLIKHLSESTDQYMRERTVDIHDISKRVMGHLLLHSRISLEDLEENVVLVAHDLMPSDAITMNKKAVLALATELGGKTSHTAILARAFEIPAVLGLTDITKIIKNGDTIIVDGDAGKVILNPDSATERKYLKLQRQSIARGDSLKALNSLKAETKDGISVMLKANIEVPEEVLTVLAHGADGIGLYRSEFLFLKPGSFATEEEQFLAYSSVLKAMGDKPVTIRTLDLGGDKMIPELESRGEKNPLLGWRAIRFCLNRTDIFLSQLKALLRASVYGNLRIMFPMISGLEEIDQAKALLEQAKRELTQAGIEFKNEIPVGIMIEIPSAALISDILAKKADFFSIGTNDLIQYTIAVDRGNQAIAYLYQPFHPGVLRLIKLVIENAHKANIPVAMCGEFASDPYASAVLLGLGLDEFSMSSQGIPLVKEIIRDISSTEAKELVDHIMTMESYKEIEHYVHNWVNERLPRKSLRV